MARRRRGIPRADVRRVRAEAKLRFGPERSALAGLVAEARGGFEKDVRVARGGAATAVRSARAQRKPLRKIYRRAVRGVNVAERDVDAAYGRAGVGSADPFRLATESESGAYRQQLAAGAAAAQRDLRRQANEARVGQVFAVATAKDKLRSDLQQLGNRLRDLGDERGAYIVSRLGELAETRGGRNTQLQVARQYGKNEAASGRTQKEIAQIYAGRGGGGGGGGAGGGGGPASRSELRGFKTDFSKALRYAKDFSAANYKRSDAADQLIKGASAVKGRGGRTRYPAVPAIDDQLALSAALDMAYDGHVSRRNAGLLRDAGLRVADLPGARSYKAWLRQTRRQQQRASRNTARQYSQGSMY